MEKQQLENYLKDIPKPAPEAPATQEELRLTLMNAKLSSRTGTFLIVLPGLLILVFFLQNTLHVLPGLTGWFDAELTRVPLPLRAVLLFLFLVGFPFIAVLMNLLAIIHYRFNPLRRELTIVVRMKWRNILIAVAGAALASFYILHLLADAILSKN
jgi:uncharacterized integral membrane protein